MTSGKSSVSSTTATPSSAGSSSVLVFGARHQLCIVVCSCHIILLVVSGSVSDLFRVHVQLIIQKLQQCFNTVASYRYGWQCGYIVTRYTILHFCCIVHAERYVQCSCIKVDILLDVVFFFPNVFLRSCRYLRCHSFSFKCVVASKCQWLVLFIKYTSPFNYNYLTHGNFHPTIQRYH